MGKNEKTPITVNDKEYILEDFNDHQRLLLNHVNDLNRKIESGRFNLDQMAVGRDEFIRLLSVALEEGQVTDDEVADQED